MKICKKEFYYASCKKVNARVIIEALKECGYGKEERRAYLEDYINGALTKFFIGVGLGTMSFYTFHNYSLFLSISTFILGFCYGVPSMMKGSDKISLCLRTAQINRELKQTGQLPENLEESLGLDRV